MWDKYTRALGPDVVRGDQSGLSLTEFRLTAGFLHCPVPFLGVRQIRAINRISRSAELAPWDVPGRYSRPICRRIVEEAGVPRDLFGRAKRAASVLFFESQSFLSPGALTDYQAWLSAHRLNGAPSIQRRLAARVVSPLQQLADASAGETMWRVVRRVTRWARHEPRFRWLFPWALARAKQSYERATDAAA